MALKELYLIKTDKGLNLYSVDLLTSALDIRFTLFHTIFKWKQYVKTEVHLDVELKNLLKYALTHCRFFPLG